MLKLLLLFSFLVNSSKTYSPIHFKVHVSNKKRHRIAHRIENTTEPWFLLNVTGIYGVAYYINLKIGTPGSNFKVLLDTGSSDFAVAINKMPGVSNWLNAKTSSTLKCSGVLHTVAYKQGKWVGEMCTDVIAMPKKYQTEYAKSEGRSRQLTAHLSLIKTADHFFSPRNDATWDGIFGLAYAKLREPLVLRNVSTKNYDYKFAYDFWPRGSLLDEMIANWNMPNVFSMQLCGLEKPSTIVNATNSVGTIYFGGIAKEYRESAIVYTAIREEWFYEIVLSNIRVNGEGIVGDCKDLNFSKAILDSGTTNIFLPTRAYRPLIQRIHSHVSRQTDDQPPFHTGHEAFWNGTRALCATNQGDEYPYNMFPLIEFEMPAYQAGTKVISIVLSPQQYVRYVGRVNHTGETRDCYAFGIQESRLRTTLGTVFLEGFYVVFDRANKRIGFANSKCNRNHPRASVFSHVNGTRYSTSGRRLHAPVDCGLLRIH